MISSPLLVHEKIWLDKPKYDAAERRYYERLAKSSESAKVANSTIVTDQDNADLVEVQDVEALVNSCSLSDKMSPTKIHQDKLNKIEAGPASHDKAQIENDKLCPITKRDPKESKSCTIVHGISKGQDNSAKQVEVLPESSQINASESGASQSTNRSKSVLINKATENESSCLPQTNKVDICSKSEKPKKSEVNSRDNTLTKGEFGDITCSKIKGQNKAKVTDDKVVTKQEFVPDKGSCIDPVSDVVKGVSQNSNSWNSLAGEVAKARQHIKNSLQCIDDIAVTSNTVSVEITNRLTSLEKENLDLKNQVSELVELLKKMDLRISTLEKTGAGSSKSTENKAPAPVPHVKKDDAEDDDGVDLFGSDSEEEDTEAAKIKEQRLAEYAARKAKKPVLIAKSNIILDVKPWDDETNMKELEAEVRKITTDGLVWGASKLVPLAYGIHKLQISCVVEDDKVSVDWLQETIQEIEDYVQSVDIAAFNKV
ncbi:uncharacterized protein [Halyomorpha halys]|uniref:uncharacterized protein isoform X2 n=1 Tax=Halyomorpha halys TaxID=286706 RepID=UPI0006D4F84F|nr:uncharacterized protein LOC106685688 isoform X2 [Halyomorpha halys]